MHQYLVCDSLLLFQIYYYRWKNPHADEVIRQPTGPIEDTPLLGNPGEPNIKNEVLRYSLCLVFVFAAGVMAWAIDSKIHGPSPPSEPEGIVEWRSQVLGWISAMLFCTLSAFINCVLLHSFPILLQWALAYHRSVGGSSSCRRLFLTDLLQ